MVKKGGQIMSIQRYQMEDVPRLDKMSYRLLYISTSRYEGEIYKRR